MINPFKTLDSPFKRPDSTPIEKQSGFIDSMAVKYLGGRLDPLERRASIKVGTAVAQIFVVIGSFALGGHIIDNAIEPATQESGAGADLADGEAVLSPQERDDASPGWFFGAVGGLGTSIAIAIGLSFSAFRDIEEQERLKMELHGGVPPTESN